jgi:LPS-assembly protein
LCSLILPKFSLILLSRYIPKKLYLIVALSHLASEVSAYSLTHSTATQEINDFTPIEVPPAIKLGQNIDSLPDFVPTAPSILSEQAITIDADSITGSVDNTLSFKGSTHLQRDNLTLKADQMDYCPNSSEVSAQGQVIAVQGKDVLRAKTFTLNTETDVGYAQSIEYFFNKANARGNADSLTSTLDRQRILTNASYTSCPVGKNDWLLKANKIILDEATQTGIAKGMSLRFMDVPIFATPYFEFPLGKDRRSGFLSPSTAYGSQSGIDVSIPYYFNLAPHYDATLTTRLMTRRGIQFNTQVRYLTQRLQGNITVDALPYDNLRKQRRWGLFTNHTYQSPVNQQGSILTAGVNIERVSDASFFADLSHSTDLVSQTILPNELWLRHQSKWATVSARAGQYQTLQDNTQSIVAPYARLPMIDLQLNPILLPKLGNITFDFNAQFTRFTHNTATQGIRAYAIPQISRHWVTDWGFIKAKAKLNMAHYTQLKGLSYLGNGKFSRAIPMLSLDTGLIFERTIPWFNTKQGSQQTVKHTLEPRLYFVYAPFKDQTAAPIFDSALTSFSLEQIFSDNVFIGQDRISNAAHITPALSTQWLNPNTGSTVLKATLGRRYYFQPQRVNLQEVSTDSNTNNNTNNAMTSSDWLFAATGQLSDEFHIDTALQYDQSRREIVNSSYTLRYTPAIHQVFSISKRFTKDTKNAIDLSGQWRFANNHAFLGKLGYSLGVPSEKLERKVTESLLGYEYDAGCWLFRVAAKRYINTANVRATSFSFQLELSGLTQSKSNTVNMLANSIPGYTPFKAKPTWTYDAFRTFE